MSETAAAHRLVLNVHTSSHSSRGVVRFASVEGESALLCSEFARHAAPGLAVGDEVRLDLPGLLPDEEGGFRARAVGRSEDRMRIRYDFEVGQPLGWLVSKFSDRRMATRIKPYALAPVRASVERLDGGPHCPVVVKDISATGIGLYVPPEQEEKLFTAWRLRVSLQIPSDTGPLLELIGDVRSRRLERGSVLYGIDFDVHETADFGAKQDVIQDYVVTCQSAAISMFLQRIGGLEVELARACDLLSKLEEHERAPRAHDTDQDATGSVDELDRIANAWHDLPDRVRRAIVLLVEATTPE